MRLRNVTNIVIKNYLRLLRPKTIPGLLLIPIRVCSNPEYAFSQTLTVSNSQTLAKKLIRGLQIKVMRFSILANRILVLLLFQPIRFKYVSFDIKL